MLTLRPFSQERGAGRLCLQKSPTTVTFIAHQEFATPVLAHMFDSLVRVSRRGEENNFVSITSTKWLTSDHPSAQPLKLTPHQGATSSTAICTQANRCWPATDCRAQAASSPRSTIHSNTRFLRFPFSNFRYSLTLFSKFFASFPHGTCSLSVYHQYLALDGIYHPIRAAIPNNSTRRRHVLKHAAPKHTRECHPLGCPVPRDFARGRGRACLSRPQFGAKLHATSSQ